VHLEHRLWSLDPDSLWQGLNGRGFSNEALRMGREGIIRDTLAKLQMLGHQPVIDRGWSQQSPRAVVLLLVILVKEGSNPRIGAFTSNRERTDTIRKFGAILQSLELRLGI
jgi:hypothetical protein